MVAKTALRRAEKGRLEKQAPCPGGKKKKEENLFEQVEIQFAGNSSRAAEETEETEYAYRLPPSAGAQGCAHRRRGEKRKENFRGNLAIPKKKKADVPKQKQKGGKGRSSTTKKPFT